MRKVLLLLLGVLMFSMELLAQTRVVSGNVLDNSGQPLPGVTVRVVGDKAATVTNAEGSFTITVAPAARSLEVSYVGYAAQTVAIPASGSVTVSLQQATTTNLDEVVVTGYTREKKSNFAGAATKVAAKAVNQVPNASLDQVLQGRAPGLYASAGSGQPGASANVIIRGVGSINGSTQPLYVIDGIPVEAAAFSALSTSDIESVDVLKDASATALYGSRGANGVIVVTTKRGKAGSKVVFGLKTQTGFSKRTTPKFEMMNSRQRIQYEEEIGMETGQLIGPGWTYSRKNPTKEIIDPATGNVIEVPKTEADFVKGDQILDSLRNMNVDWTDILFRKGSFQEHEVNATGGNEKVSFYSALNYLKQEGIALRSGLERYSLRNNVDFKSNRFSAAISSTLNYAQSSFIENENTTAVTNPFAAVYYASPYEQPYINGQLRHSGNTYAFSGLFEGDDVMDQREGSVALERLLATTSKRNELKAILGGNFRYKITNNFSLISTLGLDFRELTTERFIDPNSYTGTLQSGRQGSFNETVNRAYRLFGNGGVNFNKTFGGAHLVDVIALYEGIKTTSRGFGYTGYGINPLLPGTPAGITPGSNTGFIPVLTGARDISALQSVMGIAKYVYNNKYTLNVNYRVDGSSSLPEANRWISYYSVGAAWNMMKEGFMDNITFLNDLQVRGSYGITASPFSSSFGYLGTYTTAKYNGQDGITLSQVANPEYDWEYTKTANIGVDFALFQRRLTGTLDVYNKVTENIFISQELSRTSGAERLNKNAGEMLNRGIELALNGEVISTKDLRWTLGGNAAYNKNEITDLGQVNEFPLGTSIIRVGLPYGSHYLPKWAGVNPETGAPQYYDQDGKVTTNYNRATQSIAEFGSWLPKVQGGFNTGLNYKGAYVEAFFSFVAGNKRFNNEDYFNETPSFAWSNQSVRMLNRWRKPGDITDIQSFTTKRDFSSKDIQDASYLRFRNLNIGYNVPAALIHKATDKISAVTIFAQAQNLYTWTKWRGFDPEDNNNISTFEYPSQRTYTLGLNLSF